MTLANLLPTDNISLLVECSQTLRTDQPSLLSRLFTRLSRRILASIFLRQNAVFVLGLRFLAHVLHPCQKQPSTNTASLILRKAKSGLPGMDSRLERHPVMPSRLRIARTASSVDFVPRPFIAAMMADRFFFEKTSAIYLPRIIFKLGSVSLDSINSLYLATKPSIVILRFDESKRLSS